MEENFAWDPRLLRVNRARRTVRARTADSIRSAILDRYYKPGQRLVERALCEVTGVSRTSVREALRQLASEGLVVIQPHRGPSVASLNVEDARELYEIREALEGFAARLFVERASDETLHRLTAAGEHYLSLLETRDVPAVIDALDRFYDVLFEGCGNPLIGDRVRSLGSRLHFLRAMTMMRQDEGHMQETIASFERIIQALKRRDGDAAAQACVHQARHAAEVAIALIGEQERASSGRTPTGQPPSGRQTPGATASRRVIR